MIRITRLLLFVIVFCLPLMPEDFGIKSNTLPDMSVIRVLLLLLIFSFVFGLLVDAGMRTRLKGSIREFAMPITIMVLFFGWRIFASMLAPVGAGAMLTAIRDLVYFFIPFIVAVVCLRGFRDVRSIAKLVTVSAAVSALFGTVEYATGFQLYAHITPVDSAWHTYEPMENGEYNGTLSSFPNPLAFGAYLMAAASLSMLIFVQDNHIRYKPAMWILLSILLIGIYVSSSRGAFASVIVGLAFGVLLYVSRFYNRVQAVQRPIALLVVMLPFFVIIVAGLISTGYILAHGASEEQFSSSMMRVVQLEKSIEPIVQRPVLGYGVGEAAETLGMIALTVDNYYLTIVLESGFPGIFLFFLLVGMFLLRSVKAYQLYRHPYFIVTSIFIAALSTQLLVLSLKQVIPLLYIGFALLVVLERNFALGLRANRVKHA